MFERTTAIGAHRTVRVGLPALFMVLSAGASTFAQLPTPPDPNLGIPVDYVSWLNEVLGGGGKNTGYEKYLKAYEKLELYTGDDESRQKALKGPWSDIKPVEAWLKKNRKALKLFRKAVKSKRCYFPIALPPPKPAAKGNARRDGMMMNVILPNVRPHREATKALIAEGYHAWEQGNEKVLFDNALVVIRSAHDLDTLPSVLGHLIATANRALAYEAIHTGLALTDKRDAVAAKLLRRLTKIDAEAAPFAEQVQMERVAAWDTCQRVFRPSLHSGESDFVGFGNLPANHGRMRRIGYEDTLEEVNTYYDALDEWAAAPFYESSAAADRCRAMMEDSKNPLLKEIIPKLTRARELREMIKADRRATHLLLHLFAHHRKTGQFPATLDDLATSNIGPDGAAADGTASGNIAVDDIAALRIDPFSGQDFHYAKTKDSFKLYTVALNLKDDGGKHDGSWKEDDYVFWPAEK